MAHAVNGEEKIVAAGLASNRVLRFRVRAESVGRLSAAPRRWLIILTVPRRDRTIVFCGDARSFAHASKCS